MAGARCAQVAVPEHWRCDFHGILSCLGPETIWGLAGEVVPPTKSEAIVAWKHINGNHDCRMFCDLRFHWHTLCAVRTVTLW